MSDNGNELQPMRINGGQMTSLSRRLPAVADALRRAGVVYVRIDYRGAWDIATMGRSDVLYK